MAIINTNNTYDLLDVLQSQLEEVGSGFNETTQSLGYDFDDLLTEVKKDTASGTVLSSIERADGGTSTTTFTSTNTSGTIAYKMTDGSGDMTVDTEESKITGQITKDDGTNVWATLSNTGKYDVLSDLPGNYYKASYKWGYTAKVSFNGNTDTAPTSFSLTEITGFDSWDEKYDSPTVFGSRNNKTNFTVKGNLTATIGLYGEVSTAGTLNSIGFDSTYNQANDDQSYKIASKFLVTGVGTGIVLGDSMSGQIAKLEFSEKIDASVSGASGDDDSKTSTNESYSAASTSGLFDASIFDTGSYEDIRAALFGGDDTITINGTDSTDPTFGGYVEAGAGMDKVTGGKGNDYIDGEAGDDNLIGGAGRDEIYGGAGADKIDGGEGTDELYGDDGADIIKAGNGHDVAEGGAGDDQIDGGAGNDELSGDDGADNLLGGAGNDEIYGGADADTIKGDAGRDTLYGDDGDDFIDGGAGSDYSEGGAGNDIMLGGAGNDILKGDDGVDVIDGGAGNDRIYGGRGKDVLTGGAGIDAFGYNALFDDTFLNATAAGVWKNAVADTSSLNTDSDNYNNTLELITDFKVKDDVIQLMFTDDSDNTETFFNENVTFGSSSYTDGAALIDAAVASFSTFDKYAFVGSMGSDSYLVVDFDDNNAIDMVVKLVGINSLTATSINFGIEA